MEQKKSFDKPTQVKFREIDIEGEEYIQYIEYGIAYREEVICACCGGVFELDEVEILKVYENWVDFKDEIGE